MYFRLEAIPASDAEKAPRRSPGLLERLTGIEPAYQAWEACALPLSYSRIPSSLACTVPVREMFHPAQCDAPPGSCRARACGLRALPGIL